MVEAGGEAVHSGAGERILGKSGLNNGERVPLNPAAQSPNQPNDHENTTSMPGSPMVPRSNSQALTCPECGSKGPFYCDGHRHLKDGTDRQRWLCRACGYRFSERSRLQTRINDSDALEHVQRIQSKKLKSEVALLEGCQLGAILQEAKKLDSATETKTVAGDRKTDALTAKGLLLQYALWLQKEGYGENCRYRDCIRMLINSGANLYNPESVKEVIAKKSWKDGTKMQMAYAYDALTKMLKIAWEAPRYRQEEAFPFIPEEKEIDALILGARSKRMAAYLQTLKETMADPSEALRLRWIDINGNVIMINRPVKGHYPRPIQVSNNLISMLNALPKDSERIFPTSYVNMARSYYGMRKQIARKLNNPRILKISFVTFRHWAATMTYHQTRNILLVKKLLGHKKIENTMKYTQLIQFKDSEYEVTSATTIEEAKTVLAAGFEYVTEKDGIMLFRKPKRFVSVEM